MEIPLQLLEPASAMIDLSTNAANSKSLKSQRICAIQWTLDVILTRPTPLAGATSRKNPSVG